MNSQEIRTTFIQFFQDKGHQFVPSAPIVTKNDPTLMFTNAGMNQFKDYFLGNRPAPNSRVSNSQKCLRVSGKHNDLEEVGIDTYHHTMFEMLGNWSFGDYFKKEAINWAWELLTEVYGLPKDRLYVTVFEGDKSDNLTMDQEAYDYWKAIIAEDRILYGNKKDNFWEMGDTGPCGPCSEIHIDMRSESEVKASPGKELVNQDHPLVVEIWNLVFMQFNRQSSGELNPLPAKHVDTGMGFERLVMAIQQKKSNYDTDVFTPLIDQVSSWAKVKYGDQQEIDIALRVVVDHIRAISFAIADGQLPSNNKAGYVIRRILRRAVRYGYTFLSFKEPFLYKLLPVLSEQFSDIFPELKAQQDFVAKVIQEEEASFLRTLEVGLKKMEQIKQEFRDTKVIPGHVAFELYDTFGFPLDLTALIARESGFSMDEKGFQEEMAQQKKRSKGAATVDTGDWEVVREANKVEFVGYDELTTQAQIVRYRQMKEKNKTYYQLILDRTPFYPEGGGQVGDTGYLEDNGQKVSIVDTKKENELIIHYANELPANIEATFRCVVNENKRLLTMNNHSATHLLHAALKEVLGDHVQQKGSLVNNQLLRFDFSHFSKMSEEEIRRVEHIVNQRIRANIQLEEMRNVPMDEAKAMGATALFGEKYGEYVRVIAFDRDFSLELCGGTHVKSTGNIGLFKILSESSISAGVRRVEAITADNAEQYVYEQEDTMKELKEVLKNPKDLKKAVEDLLHERAKLQKEIESMQQKEAMNVKDQIMDKAYSLGAAEVIVDKVFVPNADMLKKLAFDIKNQKEKLVLVLAADVDGKPQIAMAIDETLIQQYDLHAGNIVRELAKHIKGGGGGQPFFATAGGKEVSGLDKVVEEAKKMLEEKLS